MSEPTAARRRHPTETPIRRLVRWLSRWAWIVPGSGCTCPFPRYANDCPRHRTRRVPGDRRITLIASAAWADGVRVEVESIDGWCIIKATADESIKGYAITWNGRDLPYAALEANRET